MRRFVPPASLSGWRFGTREGFVVLGAHFAKAPGTRSTPRLAAPAPHRIAPFPLRIAKHASTRARARRYFAATGLFERLQT